MAETSTIFGFMKYVSATDILSDFKKTVDSHFVNSLRWTLIVHHLRFAHLRYFVESVHLLLLIDLKAQDLLRLSYYL